MQVTPELIEMITAQVMKCIQGEGVGTAGNRPKLFVVGNKETLCGLGGQYVLESGADLVKEPCREAYEAFLITEMDTNLLADLALGLCHGSSQYAGAELISYALLSGRPVYAAEEGISFLRYKHTANARYYQMFVEYLKKLESFGIKVLPTDKICQELLGKESSSRKEWKEEKNLSAVCGKGQKQEDISCEETTLVSADMARRFAKKGEKTFRVTPGMIVTPLAKDVLREKKITLVYEA